MAPTSLDALSVEDWRSMQNVAKIFDMTLEDLLQVARTASSSPRNSPRSGNVPPNPEFVSQEPSPLLSVRPQRKQPDAVPESNDTTEISPGPSTWRDAIPSGELPDAIE